MIIIEIIVAAFGSIVFSIQIFLLIVWIIVLFKNSLQLRKKVKYSVPSFLNQGDILKALNVKLEYRKSLFLLAIVAFELISSILGSFSCNEILIKQFNDLNKYERTSNFPNITNNSNVVEKHKISFLHHPNFDHNLFRVIYASFAIHHILVLSPVYILMSYYAMIIKNSLSYNVSMKSVDLAREQKNLIVFSFALFIILVVPLVSVKLFILYEFIQIVVSIAQLIITFHYSSKLVCVFKWKILDTKIAFGIDNYLFKSYTKNLKKFKCYVILYKIVVTSSCLLITIFAIKNIVLIMKPYELYRLYGLNLKLFLPEVYEICLFYIHHYLLIIQQICIILYFAFLFLLNLSTIPYLLSRMNFRCLFKFLRFSSNKDLTEQLLS